MRILHTVFALLVLVSVAMLPGPSHALATSVGQHHRSMVMAGHGAERPCDHCPADEPHKDCSSACCSPAVVDPASPVPVPAARVLFVRACWRATDERRPDAARGPLLRPPTLA